MRFGAAMGYEKSALDARHALHGVALRTRAQANRQGFESRKAREMASKAGRSIQSSTSNLYG